MAVRLTILPRRWDLRWLVGLGLGVLALAALPALPATPAVSDSPAPPAPPCSEFVWDVAQERALFATAPQSVMAGSNLSSAAALRADHLFRLSLIPQPQVKFVSTPGRKILTEGAFAGLATFEVSAPGTYRIATDEPFWIDVVLDGQLVPSKDYQGVAGCRAPRKIVEFELPTAKNLVLQLSGATSTSSLVTITRTPAPKS